MLFIFQCLVSLLDQLKELQLRLDIYKELKFMNYKNTFSKNQKGSSAMPHKKNPILSENLTGLARMVRSAVIPALENIALMA